MEGKFGKRSGGPEAGPPLESAYPPPGTRDVLFTDDLELPRTRLLGFRRWVLGLVRLFLTKEKPDDDRALHVNPDYLAVDMMQTPEAAIAREFHISSCAELAERLLLTCHLQLLSIRVGTTARFHTVDNSSKKKRVLLKNRAIKVDLFVLREVF